MSRYLLGILLAFLVPLIHGWATIIDSRFAHGTFKRLSSPIFVLQLISTLALPVILFLDPPFLLSWRLLGIAFLIALIEIFYQFPYYSALKKADTSIATSLFSLGKIFVPILAFVVVREQLAPIQYIGFLLIIVSGVCLASDFKHHRLNRAFGLMLIVSLMLALQSVLFKYLFEQGASWGTATAWTLILEILVASSLMLIPANRRDLIASRKTITASGGLFFAGAFLTWFGEMVGSYALFLIPVSIVKGIASTQPLFVLVYALIFAKKFPAMFREKAGSRSLTKKVAFFLLTIVGTLLIVGL